MEREPSQIGFMDNVMAYDDLDDEMNVHPFKDTQQQKSQQQSENDRMKMWRKEMFSQKKQPLPVQQ